MPRKVNPYTTVTVPKNATGKEISNAVTKAKLESAQASLKNGIISKEDVQFLLDKLQEDGVIDRSASDLTKEYIKNTLESMASLTKEVINYDAKISAAQKEINKDLEDIDAKIKALDPDLIKKQLEEEQKLRAVSQVEIMPYKIQLVELEAKIQSMKNWVKSKNFYTGIKNGMYKSSIFGIWSIIVTYPFVACYFTFMANLFGVLHAPEFGGAGMIIYFTTIFAIVGAALASGQIYENLIKECQSNIRSSDLAYTELYNLQSEVNKSITYWLNDCKSKDEAIKLYNSLSLKYNGIMSRFFKDAPTIELESFIESGRKRISPEICQLEKDYLQAQELQKYDALIFESDKEAEFKALEEKEKLASK